MRHLIVGSGPAGAALAVSLLEHCNEDTHVTVLEAGDEPPPDTRTGASSGIFLRPCAYGWSLAELRVARRDSGGVPRGAARGLL